MKTAQTLSDLLGKGPSGLSGARRQAYELFQKAGMPSRRMEPWKYLNPEKLAKMPATLESPRFSGGQEERLKRAYLWPSEHRAVLLNGKFENRLSSCAGVSKATLATFSSAGAPYADLEGFSAADFFKEDANPFALANEFLFTDGIFFYVPKGVKLEEPVHIVTAGYGNENGPSAFSCPKIFVLLDDDASADVVLQQEGIGGNYFANTNLAVRLKKRSTLNLKLIQRGSEAGIDFLNAHCGLGASSRLDILGFTTGGSVLRNDWVCDFEGEEASASIEFAALLSGRSQLFNHIAAHHRAGKCTSKQVFKHLLAEEAQSEFNSLVHVWPGAAPSSSNQLNRNLLLSDRSRAYSRPQLRIDADDVVATHGSATGQLEERELFYLRSRGLDKATARYVLIHAFLEEILSHVHLVSLKARLEALVEDRLQTLAGISK